VSVARRLAWGAVAAFAWLAARPQASAARPPAAEPAAHAFEGYGAVSRGGADGDVYRVTTLKDDGRGSLRHGVLERRGPRTIVFEVGGTITLMSDLVVREPFLTIDGSTAPAPGITISQNTLRDEFVVGGTHDVILTQLRFHGLWHDGGRMSNNASTLNLDGDRKPDRAARRIVLDHLTIRGSTDSGPDIYGPVEDVTLSWCLIFDSLHPTTVSGRGLRERVSMHHNVYARNGERNPQLRGGAREFDYVNNVVAFWGAFPSSRSGYGVRLRAGQGEGRIQANIVNNAFVPKGTRFEAWALVYGDRPGPADDGGGRGGPLGNIWVAGNLLPRANRDHHSTVDAPNAVPERARVTTWPAAELARRVLPEVGMRHRSAEEKELLAELEAAMKAR
jgi:hypothetical protein